jgi:hypothetical protein
MNSGRRNIHIAPCMEEWRSDCSALLDQVECCVAYANKNVDGAVMDSDRNFVGTLCCVVANGHRGEDSNPVHTHTHTHIHTYRYLLEREKKQFLCACGKSYTHTHAY